MSKRVVELLTMHLAPKQILINAHVKMRQDLLLPMKSNVRSRKLKIESNSAEPKVEMIFLEAARDQLLPSSRTASPERIDKNQRGIRAGLGETNLFSLHPDSAHRHQTRCYCYCHTPSI